MIENIKNEYCVKTCPVNEPQELEQLLNEMAEQGWDIYTLHEAESKDGDFVYNCIFLREYQEFIQTESTEILDVSDFKTRMEKMMISSEEPYQQCKEIQLKISEKDKEIEKIKHQLENATDSKKRDKLNEDLSEILEEMDELKDELTITMSPFKMYERIGQDKIAIVLSDELLQLADPKTGGQLISETVGLRQKLTDELGYIMPSIKFTNTETLEANEYRLDIRGYKALTGTVYLGHVRLSPEQANLTRKPKDAIEDTDPLTGERVFWLKEEKTKDFWEKGLTPAEVIAKHLEILVIKQADELIDYSDITRYMEIAGLQNLYLIEHLIPQLLSLGDLKYILGNLIRERVSIRDVVFIFEKLNDFIGETKDKEELLKRTRKAMAKQICQSITDENGNIYALTISKEESEKLENQLEASTERFYFSAEDAKIKKLIKKITEAVKNSDYNISNIAVLCHSGIRAELFDLLEKFIPNATVLSYEETANNCHIECIAEIA